MIVGLVGIMPFIPQNAKILDSNEQALIKAGKTFWEWDSPYGSYAVHYIEKGIGSKHILFLHGFRANTFTWRHLIDPLAQAGYHVWVIDLLGFGFSDKPSQVPYGLDFFTEQINAFMKGQQISHAHLVGNSMGGGLALGMAVNYPHRVDSLTLIAALGYPLEFSFYLTIGKNFGHLIAPFLGPTLIRKGLEDIVYRKEIITNEQIEAYSLPYRFPGGTHASTMILENFDNQQLLALSQRFSKVFHPILLIWGDRDKLIPMTHYECFIRDFPASDRVLIKNCGHIPQEEAPEEVVTSLIRFLDNQEVRSY